MTFGGTLDVLFLFWHFGRLDRYIVNRLSIWRISSIISLFTNIWHAGVVWGGGGGLATPAAKFRDDSRKALAEPDRTHPPASFSLFRSPSNTTKSSSRVVANLLYGSIVTLDDGFSASAENGNSCCFSTQNRSLSR